MALVLVLLLAGAKAPKLEAHLSVTPPMALGPVEVTVRAWLVNPGLQFYCARVTYELLAGEFPTAGEEPLRTSTTDSVDPCDPYAQEDRVPTRVSFGSRTFRFAREAGDFRVRATFDQAGKRKRVERVVRIR